MEVLFTIVVIVVLKVVTSTVWIIMVPLFNRGVIRSIIKSESYPFRWVINYSPSFMNCILHINILH